MRQEGDRGRMENVQKAIQNALLMLRDGLKSGKNAIIQ